MPSPSAPGRAERRHGAALIRRALAEHPAAPWWGIGTAIGWTLTKLATPVLLTRAIDVGIVAGDRAALVLSVGCLVLVGTAGALAAGLRRYFGQSLAYRVEADLRMRIFTHVHRLHLG